MKKLLLVACACLCLSVPAGAGWFTKDAPPISLDDVRTIVKALRPISHGNRTDVAVYVWADGGVYISIKLPNGADVFGRGETLKDALTSLTAELDANARNSVNANEAVRAILNDGKPSQ